MGKCLISAGGMVADEDLDAATATADNVLAGKTFLAGGESELQTGRMPEKGAWSSSVAMNGSVVVPAGHHNGGGKVNGPSITDHGAWTNTIDPGKFVYIPQGYHNGSGKVTAKNCNVKVLETTASDSGYHGPNHSANASVNIGGLGTIVGVYAGIGGSSIYDQNQSGGKHNSSISISGVSISGNTASATVTWYRSFYGGEYWSCSAIVRFVVVYY